MSDDLERMLDRSSHAKRPTAVNPRLPLGPRVQGGLPLEGGPKLEIPVAEPKTTKAKDPAHAVADPHVAIPLADAPTSKARGKPAAPTLPLDSDDGRREARSGHQMVAVGLTKSFHKGPVEVPVLKGVNLGVAEGEFLAVVGQSGSGKSTLLHLLGTLDAPDSGEIHFGGQRIDRLPAAARDRLRNRHFGMIFQFYHLLPELSTLENVLVPLMIAQGALGYLRERRRHRQAAMELLDMVGLGHRLRHKPRELSGGEMQRAAIARALIAGPQLLLADEPTGNLDRATGSEIMGSLATLNRHKNLTIIMVTHDPAIAQQADRIVRLVDGRIEG